MDHPRGIDMRTIEQKVYTIDTHPDKESVFDWIRDNWHDLNEHSVNEVVDSLKQLADATGGNVDYCIGAEAHQGQYIKVSNIEGATLDRLRSQAEDCPLTGVYWDVLVLSEPCEIEQRVLYALHADTEYIYSDEGLTELCEANEYEFHESGEFYAE